MDFFLPLCSSSIAATIVYPIDVVKSQIQLLKLRNVVHDTFKYNQEVDFKSVTKYIYQNDGVRGFYRGCSSFLLTYPVFWALYFQVTKHKLEYTDSKYVNDISTALYGSTVASIVANPLFVIKTRLQSELIMTGNHKSILNVSKELYNEGFYGMTRGLSATMFNNSKLAIQMPLFNYLKEKTDNVFLSSVIAKTSCSMLTYPMDLIRTNQRNTEKHISLRYIFTNIYKQNGIRGYYQGIGVYTLMTCPNFVIMMCLHDYLKSLKF